MKSRNQNLSVCFFLCCLFSLTSCLNSRKIDKFVTKHYEATPPAKPAKPVENIVVSSPISTEGPVSVTTGKTYNWLPLIVYLQYKHAMTCTLNPEHAITAYLNTFYKVSSKKLSKKIGSKQLNLSIEKIPHQFQVLDEAQMIFLGIVAISWDKISIRSVDKILEVRYQLLENGKEIRSGILTSYFPEDVVGTKKRGVSRSDISEYIISYEKNIAILSQRMADQLERELQLVNQ